MRFGQSVLCGLLVANLAGCDTDRQSTEGLRADTFRCVNGAGAGIIALDKVTISGTVDVYADGVGAIHGNNLVDMSGNLYIESDVYSVHEIKVNGNAHEILGQRLTGVDRIFAAVLEDDAAAAEAQNSNDLLELKKGNRMVPAVDDGELKMSGQQRLTMPAGTYWFENGMSISGQAVIELEGPVKIYVGGQVSISGTTETNDDSAYPLEIISVAEDNVNISGTSDAQLHVYAPLSDVSLSGTTQFDGTVLGNVVTISGTAYVGAAGDAINYADGCGDDDDDDDPPGDEPHDPDDHPEIPDTDQE